MEVVLNLVFGIIVLTLFYLILRKPFREWGQSEKEVHQKLAGSSDPAKVKSMKQRLTRQGSRLDSYLDPEVSHLRKELPPVVRETTGSSGPWQQSIVAQQATVSHLTTKGVEFIRENRLGSDEAFLLEATGRITDKAGEVLSIVPSEAHRLLLETVAAELEEEFDADFESLLR